MQSRQHPPAILSLVLLLFAGFSWAEVVVVVNRDSNITNISKAQAANVFLGKSKIMPDGQLVIPIDQKRGSAVRDTFYLKLVSKGRNQLNAYWSRQVFTGKSQPPVSVGNHEDVKLLVSNNPNMIGYIDAAAVDSTVKVILRLP